jgi:hypothetical protein
VRNTKSAQPVSNAGKRTKVATSPRSNRSRKGA